MVTAEKNCANPDCPQVNPQPEVSNLGAGRATQRAWLQSKENYFDAIPLCQKHHTS